MTKAVVALCSAFQWAFNTLHMYTKELLWKASMIHTAIVQLF